MNNQNCTQKLLYSAIITFGMAFVMSGTMSFAMMGLHTDFPSISTHVDAWLPAWRSAFVIAWPLAFLFSLVWIPQFIRIAAKIDEHLGAGKYEKVKAS